MEFLIITGMSGAGKSVALDFFEDMGYFCIDNLPPAFINKFAELCLHSELKKIAVVIDIRGREFFNALFDELAVMEEKGVNFEILYLEASDDSLIRRYKETRRKHPLDAEGRVLDAIHKERQILEELRGKANKIIDTSQKTKKEFNEELKLLYSFHRIDNETMSVSIISFGYKYGIPLDADMVFDVRFLPNPHYVNSLREHTGEEDIVQDYILKWPLTEKFYKKFFDFVEFLLPEYKKEGKSHLMIAIGCTGGKHRSVTTAIKLKDKLLKKGYRVIVEHKDVNK
ncbi:RNase adapter RapZ [Iocasia frigidifontis]|uniref:RNase adapter RapZ n=1 Tax=Iocasia fonsfrigidae TaxID=2682810 RepID=A0A8A7KBV2_9FIRM|nr:MULTISPECIES: RNase adapter RapZ [Halanaerobiaceae]AZO94131.1 RNase adapter RapZ [Halocella sp. SP3-1]MTI61366.1 RNase adapter RapZ [Bacillota bacterium]QTL97048.1 RNase adapter RapZ [Iocasia fonsfrigidae]